MGDRPSGFGGRKPRQAREACVRNATMKTLADPTNALARGLAAIRVQYKVPGAFPPDVLAAADEAAKRPITDHVDRTAMPVVPRL